MVAPEEPIPVILSRDEEELCDNETDGLTKDDILPLPPPAYGLWRGSTVSKFDKHIMRLFGLRSIANGSEPHSLAKS